MNNHTSGLSLQAPQIPVKGCDFNPAAKGCLHFVNDSPSNKVLKTGRTGIDKEPHKSRSEQQDSRRNRQGKMAQKEAAQTAWLPRDDSISSNGLGFIATHPFRRRARNRWSATCGGANCSLLDRLRFAASHRAGFNRLGGRRGGRIRLAHSPPLPVLGASEVSSDGSMTSTSPCLRRFFSQSSKSAFTCRCSSIS